MASDGKKAFNGTWVLDWDRSENIEELLKAQGIGYLKRKAAASVSVTMTVKISEDGNSMVADVQSFFRKSVEEIPLDGRVEQKDSPELGPIEQKAYWKEEEDGQTIQVQEVISNLSGYKGTTTIRRRIIDNGNAMETQFTFKPADGLSEVTCKRVLKKQA